MHSYKLLITLLFAGICLAAPAQKRNTEAIDGDYVATGYDDSTAIRRDSIPHRLRHSAMTPDQRRENRGISSRSTRIVPRGQWVFGGTMSYSTHSNDKYTFLMVEGINSEDRKSVV